MCIAFWATAGGVVGVYVLLFILARRPVTLRFGRLGWLLATIVTLRMLEGCTSGCLWPLPDFLATVVMGLLAAYLVQSWRVWLVRATAAELHEQIQTACRGLFLGVAEDQAGRLELAAVGKPALEMRKLTPRVQLLELCPVAGPGKVALLCDWLAKQYPGPVPRLRFTLKGGAS
jgi:hypothetical protein